MGVWVSLKTLSPCRRRESISRLVGLVILPFLRLGVARQCSWPAGKGPWQLAHLAFSVQFGPEGPVCRLTRVLQLLHLVCLVHFVGLQYPWHPGSCLEIAVFLLIILESSLALNSLNGLTGVRNDMIQVIFPVWGLAP